MRGPKKILSDLNTRAYPPAVNGVHVIPKFLTNKKCDSILEEYTNRESDKLNEVVDEIAPAKGKQKFTTATSFFLAPCKTFDLHNFIVEKLRDVAKYNLNMEAHKLFAYWKQGLFINQYNAGGHRGWHYDGGVIADPTGYGHPTEERMRSFSTKRLTCVIQLNDPKDYKGGNLEFFSYQHPKGVDLRARGTAVIFHSNMWHRITPVKSGQRNSLNIFLHED